MTIDRKGEGENPVVVTFDNSMRVEEAKGLLRQMLHLPLSCQVSLTRRGTYLPVDDLACVREIGLQMFDTLTVSTSYLSGGMMSKNRNDGSDSDEKYHKISSNQEITRPPPKKAAASSRVEPSQTPTGQTGHPELNNSGPSHESCKKNGQVSTGSSPRV